MHTLQDRKNARELLETQNFSCVMICNGKRITSAARGIAPLVELWESGEKLSGACAADKIVGKAAALLMAGMGVSHVYAKVLSKPAARVLQFWDVPYECETLTDAIQNRAGDGLCPMEQAVKDVDEPQEAFLAVKETLARLRA